MLIVIIATFLVGYFLGMISCMLQIIRKENKYNKKFQDIMDNKNRRW